MKLFISQLGFIKQIVVICLSLGINFSYASVEEFVLENGLKVVVSTNKAAPIITTQLWYKVGSSYELGGKTGISHALEHMMFKGSSKLKAGEASQILSKFGISENAYTSYDYTVYHQFLSKRYIDLVLEIEADRMASLSLPSNEFISELEVIKEERRLRTDNKPIAKAYEQFLASAHIASAYRSPVIGWMEDIERLDIRDLRTWYKSWYAPNNATLVIVGNITAKEVKPSVQKWFGKIPSKDLPAAPTPLEIKVPYERRLHLLTSDKVPKIFLGFNVPSLKTAMFKKDAYALMMVSAILDSGVSSRLQRDLVRKGELVSSISADYDFYNRGDGLFVFRATPNIQKHKTLEQVEDALWQQIADLKSNTISFSELNRVRTQLVTSMIYDRDSIGLQAQMIGMFESIGLSWRDLQQVQDELKTVTPADIKNVVIRYLVKSRSTTALVFPKEGSSRK